MSFKTALKCFLFHPDVDDPVGDSEAKFSSKDLTGKLPGFTITVEHSGSTPTNTEIKTAFETYFGVTNLAYKSFIVGAYNGVIRAGNPEDLTDAADATFFNMTMHSDGTTVTYSVPVARFLSYGMSEIETNLFWSIYPTNGTHYANMLKKTSVDNQKVIDNGSAIVNSSQVLKGSKSYIYNGVEIKTVN